MTERIMHSEKKHAEYIKQTRKKRTTDTSNECQYTCLYNIRTYNEITIIKFSEFRNELSITLGCSVIRLWQVEEVLRRDLG